MAATLTITDRALDFEAAITALLDREELADTLARERLKRVRSDLEKGLADALAREDNGD